MAATGWTAADLPSLEGRTVVVTGASSGIGAVTARELARVGARVILAVRDEAKGERVAAAMSGDREVRRLDLADLASVRAFAAGWSGDLDILINNAGIMAVPRGRTADGFETQFGTNHLGHFALTNLLIGHITDRVVTLSSTMHKLGRMRFDDLNHEHSRYRRWSVYSQSKLANLLFTSELQRRLAAAGSDVRAVAAHPGYASTHLQSQTGSAVLNAFMSVSNRCFAQSAEQGALPTLYAATQDLPGDSFVGPDGRQEMRGHPTLVGRTKQAADPEAARRLWVVSEDLTHVRWPW